MGATTATGRSIRLVRSPTADGIGVFRIDVGGKAQFYTLREIPCEIGGRGFAVHRLGMGEVYHATDTNLKREVAIEVLPAAVALSVFVRRQYEPERGRVCSGRDLLLSVEQISAGIAL